ncbi:MAG TPA: hypothetical protein VG123_29575, partial [Streptosporangiaceae bacterium]|nr:hypothetical protein [Streptosporangiaceae bacterium]
VMFLDCPAYLDAHGAERCGLPAEIEDRYTMRSSDGPLESLIWAVPQPRTRAAHDGRPAARTDAHADRS